MQPQFQTCDQVMPAIRLACEQHADVARFCELGASESGRSLYGALLGTGPRRVSLIAGAHSDEPTGPETLRRFILDTLAQRDASAGLLADFQFAIVPHVNPDGEAANWRWMCRWPSVQAYLLHAFREPPGRDLEFGFPDTRPENRAVSTFLREHGPFDLHMSLHSMAFSDGVMLLVERSWIERTHALRADFTALAARYGLPLHDHDRKGEKGFEYIGPGLSTTPNGAAMRAHFEARGDRRTANMFHASSMEFVRSLGGDPLCLVTELPLFLLGNRSSQKRESRPDSYLSFKAKLPELQARLAKGEDIQQELDEFNVRPLELGLQMRLQKEVILLALDTIRRQGQE